MALFHQIRPNDAAKPKKPKVANTVANPVANVANKPRYVKWREANPELWLERQRGYQAKHRAKAKEPK